MYLGIIPARGGSKGIPRKNIKTICGHPLLAWSIKAALDSELLDKFVVTTEDEEIASVARSYGAKVLIRPEELAGDAITSREVVKHALECEPAEASILLQPTSPVRRAGLIDRVIQAFQSGDYTSMATGFNQLLYPPHGVEHRRQDIKTVFVNDGSVIITKKDTLIKDNSLFGQKAGTLITSREENVDIDESFDFWLADKVLERALKEGWMTCPELLKQS